MANTFGSLVANFVRYEIPPAWSSACNMADLSSDVLRFGEPRGRPGDALLPGANLPDSVRPFPADCLSVSTSIVSVVPAGIHGQPNHARLRVTLMHCASIEFSAHDFRCFV